MGALAEKQGKGCCGNQYHKDRPACDRNESFGNPHGKHRAMGSVRDPPDGRKIPLASCAQSVESKKSRSRRTVSGAASNGTTPQPTEVFGRRCASVAAF